MPGTQSVNGAFVVLLTADDYFLGVKVLQWSLRSVNSAYPLVVLYTSQTLSPLYIQKLRDYGCILKETSTIAVDVPDAKYAQSYYNDTWTKLQAFALIEYSRVVLLDADMLVRQNIDDLMTIELPDGWIAASPGCVCNPMKVPTYPVNWRPENCSYTYFSRSPHESNGETGKKGVSYFNSGLIVLRPSIHASEELKNELNRIDSLDKYRFPDQDFLNEVYAGRWICLPYYYNALRPLTLAHPNMWRDNEVRIAHYIFTKPWLDTQWSTRTEEDRRKDAFYTVNSWWFEAYEKSKNYI